MSPVEPVTCDACGVRAVCRVYPRYGLPNRILTLCGHHAREHKEALKDAGYRLVWEAGVWQGPWRDDADWFSLVIVTAPPGTDPERWDAP